MQIIQFVIDLFVVYLASTSAHCPLLRSHVLTIPLAAYSHFVAVHYSGPPTFGDCAGSESSSIFGCALLTAYLGLFIQFYNRTYKIPVKDGPKRVCVYLPFVILISSGRL